MENIGLEKLKIQMKNPYVFDFLASASQESSSEVKEIFKSKSKGAYEKGFATIYTNIDYSKFREDIPLEKSMDIIMWSIFGFGEKMMKKMGEVASKEEFGEDSLQEWKDYGIILKKIFYKDEKGV